MSNLNKELQAHLICNNKSKRIKVLNEINGNLRKCESFSFSIAFINDSGLQCIKQTLFDLESDEIKGKLITSTYLGFNNPKSFRELLKFKNVETRIFMEEGFHPKGYIFDCKEEINIIIGSSNLTASALTKNQEWNICLSSKANEDIVNRINEEFIDQWERSIPLTEEWIKEYEKVYKEAETYSPVIIENKQKEIKPNLMQIEALSSLRSLREQGKEKALLISATGTGKTFLSAFDVKQFDAKRVLFVVHRENIAKTAMFAFEQIMPNKKYGLFIGSKKDFDADYLFSTVQTISKNEYLGQFAKDYFDYIIIDEVHHLGAGSYQNIFKYFTPKFLLGMTATPERTDNYDIYKDFEYNIAYEIRLQQAMEEELLCPFHYFGISDFELDGKQIDEYSDVAYLTCEARVDHIIKAADKYSYSGNKVHGLIFVSRVEEAKKFSEILNTKGFKTTPVIGETADVEKCIDLLESDDPNNYYDYLVCVDKFNEGIDIPKVNQIIMVRPTSSAIIFVQQLGRGLRKVANKDYTVVIDLIGNYQNNYLIPMALSGDRTFNKDENDRFVISTKAYIPGSSTIDFDIITKERIFNSIQKMPNINKMIKSSFELLSYKLGRRPYLIDCYKKKDVDPILITKRFKSYFQFIKKCGTEDIDVGDEYSSRCLEYLSSTILNGKRCHELYLLKYLLDNKIVKTVELQKYLSNICKCSKEEFISALSVLKGEFEQKDEVIKNNRKFLMIESDNLYTKLTDNFISRLENVEFKKEIEDICDTGLAYYNDIYKNADDYPFVIGKKYSRRDACRLLNVSKDLSSTMYGMYKYKNDVLIFVTYKKDDPTDEKNYVEGKPDYADAFINNDEFEWMTQMGRGIDSSYYKDVKNAKNRRLFIQKNSDETDFYYIGKVEEISSIEDSKKDNNGNLRKVVRVSFLLDKPIENELLEYFNNYEKKV